MPYDAASKTFEMPLESATDAAALFDEGLMLAQHPSPSRREWAARALEDEFLRLGAVHPEWVRPLHPRFAQLSDKELQMFSFRFSTWLFLLEGADDACVEVLTALMKNRTAAESRLVMLAAIGSELALKKVADCARQYDLIQELEWLGFEVPVDDGFAIRRFTTWRRAIKVVPFRGLRSRLTRVKNPVGLPLAEVMGNPDRENVSWHYISFDLDQFEGLPSIPVNRLHLVSPPLFFGWTLYCDIQEDGKYAFGSVHLPPIEQEESPNEMDLELRTLDNDRLGGLGRAKFLPMEHEIGYSNGHVYWGDIVGEAGGAPMDGESNPKCPNCQRLMFYLATVQSSIRETKRDFAAYGVEFRSLFFCEDCLTVACTATA